MNTVKSLDEELRTLVRKARKNRKISQQRLADFMNELYDANWFQQTVQKVESGNRSITAGEMIALMSILGIDVWTKK